MTENEGRNPTLLHCGDISDLHNHIDRDNEGRNPTLLHCGAPQARTGR